MLAIRCFKLAAVYLIIGLSLGVFMGATHQYAFAPVHAHINLLGWVCLLLAGLLFTRFPQLAQTKLATAFFWVFNLFLPVSMILLALVQLGNEALGPLLGICSIGIWVGGVCLALNLLLNLRASDISA